MVVLGGEPVPIAPPVWATVGPETANAFAAPCFAPDDVAGIARLILSGIDRMKN